MAQRDQIARGDVPLRDYLNVLFTKWWVVALVFLLAVVGAIVLALRTPNVYEARTRILIVARASEQLSARPAATGTTADRERVNPLVGSGLSVQTLSALATTHDLLQRIILALDLKDPATGQPWGAEALTGMMRAKVETTGQAGSQLTLPLLTMTVRGDDPALLKRIANKWAELFAEQNAQLFTTEAARSYEFLLQQYQETEEALARLETERAQYLVQHPLSLLRDELAFKQDALKDLLDQLLKLSAELGLKQREYTAALELFNELTVDGQWIGAPSAPLPKSNPLTPEQQDVLLARDRFLQLRDQVERFASENDLTVLAQRQTVATALALDYARELQAAENALRVLRQTLQAQETELKAQPQFFVLTKAVDDPVLLQQLGLDPTAATWERLRQIGVQSEEVNPIFVTLMQQVVLSRTNEQTESERVATLRARLDEARTEVRALERERTEKEVLQLTRLREERDLARGRYEGERDRYVALQSQIIQLRNTLQGLQAPKAEQDRLVGLYRSDHQALSTRVTDAELKLGQLDRQIGSLTTVQSQLAPLLQEARIAKAEQAGSIRVVEAAIEPQARVAPNRRQSVLVAGVLGLVLGVVAAFGVHYLQTAYQSPGGGPRRQAR